MSLSVSATKGSSNSGTSTEYILAPISGKILIEVKGTVTGSRGEISGSSGNRAGYAYLYAQITDTNNITTNQLIIQATPTTKNTTTTYTDPCRNIVVSLGDKIQLYASCSFGEYALSSGAVSVSAIQIRYIIPSN